MVRCVREYEDKGSCQFLTLTYNPEHIRYACSLWSASKETGELTRVTPPALADSREFIHSSQVFSSSRDALIYKQPLECPVIDEDEELFFQYTPTLYNEDVRLMIKRFRERHRKLNDLPDFTYLVAGEYGHRGTRRPHYHMLLFGLTYKQANELSKEWLYGYTYLESVKTASLKDATAVSRYVSKYCCKGFFDTNASRTGLTISKRILISQGLGCKLSKRLFNHYTCQDICRYDIDDPVFPDEATAIKVYEEIPKRLVYKIGNFNYKLPVNYVKKIFHFKLVDGVSCWSKIWYQTKDYLRSQSEAARLAEFEEFANSQSDTLSLQEVCSLYTNIQIRALQDRERLHRQRLKQFYSKSKL